MAESKSAPESAYSLALLISLGSVAIYPSPAFAPDSDVEDEDGV